MSNISVNDNKYVMHSYDMSNMTESEKETLLAKRERAKKLMQFGLAQLSVHWTVGFTFASLCLLKEDPKCPTFAVSCSGRNILMHYNPDVLERIDGLGIEGARMLVFILMHEVLHIAMRDLTTRRSTDPGDIKRDNIAADLQNNALIENRERPMAHANDETIFGPAPGRRKGDLIGLFPGEGDFKEFPNKKAKELYLDMMRNDKFDDEKIEELLKDMIGSHDHWADQGELDGEQIDRETINSRIKSVVEGLDKSGGWGNTPENLKEAIRTAQSNQVHWLSLIKYYFGQSYSKLRQSTMRRPDRRYGYPNPGKALKGAQDVLCELDCSGSMFTGKYKQTFAVLLGEITTLNDLVGVWLHCFDTETKGEPVRWSRQIAESFDIHGGGGTDFEPAFQTARDRGFRTLIILTDGECCIPTHQSDDQFEVIWILTPDGGGKESAFTSLGYEKVVRLTAVTL